MPLVRASEQQELNSSNIIGTDDMAPQILHNGEQQLAHCCCLQREQVIDRLPHQHHHHHHPRHQPRQHRQQQDYVLIKKCRQCRKQIRSDSDQDDDENAHAGEDEEMRMVQYCECLLRNQARAGLTTTSDGSDDDDDDDDKHHGGRSNAGGRIAGRIAVAKRAQRARRLRAATHENAGKRIRPTTNAAIAVVSSSTSLSSSTSSSSSSSQTSTKTVINSPPAANLHNGDGDVDDDNNDTEDLHARLVGDTKLNTDTETSSLMDTTGLPTYEAASKLQLISNESN